MGGKTHFSYVICTYKNAMNFALEIEDAKRRERV